MCALCVARKGPCISRSDDAAPSPVGSLLPTLSGGMSEVRDKWIYQQYGSIRLAISEAPTARECSPISFRPICRPLSCATQQRRDLIGEPNATCSNLISDNRRELQTERMLMYKITLCMCNISLDVRCGEPKARFLAMGSPLAPAAPINKGTTQSPVRRWW